MIDNQRHAGIVADTTVLVCWGRNSFHGREFVQVAAVRVFGISNSGWRNFDQWKARVREVLPYIFRGLHDE